jgi:hypothetical protein
MTKIKHKLLTQTNNKYHLTSLHGATNEARTFLSFHQFTGSGRLMFVYSMHRAQQSQNGELRSGKYYTHSK